MGGQKLEEKSMNQRNFTGFGLNMNPVVSIASGLFILLFSAARNLSNSY